MSDGKPTTAPCDVCAGRVRSPTEVRGTACVLTRTCAHALGARTRRWVARRVGVVVSGASVDGAWRARTSTEALLPDDPYAGREIELDMRAHARIDNVTMTLTADPRPSVPSSALFSSDRYIIGEVEAYDAVAPGGDGDAASVPARFVRWGVATHPLLCYLAAVRDPASRDARHMTRTIASLRLPSPPPNGAPTAECAYTDETYVLWTDLYVVLWLVACAKAELMLNAAVLRTFHLPAMLVTLCATCAWRCTALRSSPGATNPKADTYTVDLLTYLRMHM